MRTATRIDSNFNNTAFSGAGLQVYSNVYDASYVTSASALVTITGTARANIYIQVSNDTQTPPRSLSWIFLAGAQYNGATTSLILAPAVAARHLRVSYLPVLGSGNVTISINTVGLT